MLAVAAIVAASDEAAAIRSVRASSIPGGPGDDFRHASENEVRPKTGHCSRHSVPLGMTPWLVGAQVTAHDIF